MNESSTQTLVIPVTIIYHNLNFMPIMFIASKIKTKSSFVETV